MKENEGRKMDCCLLFVCLFQGCSQRTPGSDRIWRTIPGGGEGLKCKIELWGRFIGISLFYPSPPFLSLVLLVAIGGVVILL